MAAPFKRTNTLKASELAAQILAEVSKQLERQTTNIKEVQVEVHLIGHGARPFGDYFPNDYRDIKIKVGKTEWCGLDVTDVARLQPLLTSAMEHFDNVETKDIFFSYGNFTPDVAAFPATFRMLGTPCKSFKELAKIVEKKYHFTIKPTDLYNVGLFGKSGLYNESGARSYTAFDERKCNRLIKNIKSFGRKRTTCAIVTNDYIDTDYSERYLTECYGHRCKTLKISRP